MKQFVFVVVAVCLTACGTPQPTETDGGLTTGLRFLGTPTSIASPTNDADTTVDGLQFDITVGTSEGTTEGYGDVTFLLEGVPVGTAKFADGKATHRYTLKTGAAGSQTLNLIEANAERTGSKPSTVAWLLTVKQN